MVTGSHIPADRNGIKFYFPDREILKKDEEPILSLWRELRGKAHVPDGLDVKLTVEASGFEERYTKFLGYEALKGLKVVFWEHSSVARDMFMRVLRALGAEVMGVGRLNAFTPVDTEAVDNADELAQFIRVNGANALVSTDGDGDRPLLLDENGQMLRGDSIGALVCRLLNADFVATPISSNSLVDEYLGPQVKLVKTKIGSPFVIEEILRARDAGYERVMGYEANGGFILGSSLSMGGRVIESLMTRDSFLPVLVLLAEASRRGVTLSQLSKELPSRFSESGLLRPLEMEKATLILAKSREIVESLGVGRILDLNVLDGMRYLLEGGKVVHLRPSGNAPEFRIYTEAASSLEAKELLKLAMSCIARA
jgi:phosphomannomutase